jgi:Zn-dependent protease with chaperone function
LLQFALRFAESCFVTALENQLEPLPYHLEVREYLKSRERELWKWFASAQAKADYTENLRLELLKSTYRLAPEGHPELYANLNEAKAKLQLDIPVTLYQAQNSSQLNAALFFIPEEGHIVFSGPVFHLLNAEELKSVLGHELAHYHLWRRDGGEFHISDRLLQTVSNDPRAAASHEQTARRYQLYTEIFADRGSLCVTDDVNPVVAGLVKIQTGLSQVSAQGYLNQAEEIFAKGNVSTEGLSHPEAFIRARALTLWQEKRENATAQIVEMIEGAAALDELDLLGQAAMAQKTRRLLEWLLQPKWVQTPAVLGHARLFFDDFKPVATRRPAALDELKPSDQKTSEYFCYVLLDFVTADPELDEMPLAAALDLSGRLELDAQFEKLAARELKIKVRDVKRLKEQAAALLAKAEVNGG